MLAWTITVDNGPDRIREEFRDFIWSLAGSVFPDDCKLSSSEIASDPQAMPFRISDEVGVLIEGFFLGEIDDLPPIIPGDAEPWRCFCSRKPALVELFKNGDRQQATYLGHQPENNLEGPLTWSGSQAGERLINASTAAVDYLLTRFEKAGLDSVGKAVLLELYTALDQVADVSDNFGEWMQFVMEDVFTENFARQNNDNPQSTTPDMKMRHKMYRVENLEQAIGVVNAQRCQACEGHMTLFEDNPQTRPDAFSLFGHCRECDHAQEFFFELSEARRETSDGGNQPC